jgi:hypothetical protein
LSRTRKAPPDEENTPDRRARAQAPPVATDPGEEVVPRARVYSAGVRTLRAAALALAAVVAIAAVLAVVLLALRYAAGLIENSIDARTPVQRTAESRSLFIGHALVWGVLALLATVALALRGRAGGTAAEAPQATSVGALGRLWTAPRAAFRSSVSGLWRSWRKRAWFAAPVGVSYLVLALVMMWPATFRLAEVYVGERDANYYFWLNWRVGRLIASGDIWSWRIPDVVWPVGVDLRLADGLLPTLIGGASNLVAEPVLAYNLGLVTATLLNLWAAGRLARLYTESRLVRVVAAAAFALAPSIVLRMPVHFTMYFVFVVPLLLERAVRVARGDEPIRPLLTGSLLWLAYLCGIYTLIFGGLAYVIVVARGLLRGPSPLSGPARLAATGLVALLLMTPFLLPRLELDRAEREAGGQPILTSVTQRGGADATSLFVQPQGSTFELPGMQDLREGFRANRHEATVFPGLLLLAALGGALVSRLRLAGALLVSTVLLWVLSMGGTFKLGGETQLTYPTGQSVLWMPYPALLELPGLGSLKAPNRTSFTIAAVLTVALAALLGQLFGRWRSAWARAVLVAACGTVLATNLILPVPIDSLPSSPSLTAALSEMSDRREPGDSALVVPADCNGRTLWTVKLQIMHRTPLVGCQASPAQLPWYSGLDVYAESEGLAALRCRQKRVGRRRTQYSDERIDASDVSRLRADLGVRFLIVDRLLLSGPGCTRLAAEIYPFIANFESLGENSRWLVVDARE